MPPIYIFPTISHFELKLWFSNGGTLWYHQEYIKCLRWLTTLEMYYTKNAAFWSVWILFCVERTTKADLNQEKSSMLFCLISRKHISAITKGKHILILSKSYCCSVCVFRCYSSGSFHRSAKACSMIKLNYRNIDLNNQKIWHYVAHSYLDALIWSKVVLVLISEQLD